MQKLLYFLHGDADETTKDFFLIQLKSLLSELAEEEVKLGKIENSFLLEKKYTFMYQVNFENKDIMDAKMISEKGKQLNRNIMNFTNFITIIILNY